MSASGKGDWLECVRGDGAPEFGYVVAGQVYRCEGLHPLANELRWFCGLCGSADAPAIVLEGFPVRDYWSWCLCCFKPAGYRPTEEITRLLKAPNRVREDA